jgi:hypothetical protein
MLKKYSIATINSDFFPSMTIDELVSHFFVENASWKTNISYSSFYSQCKPTFCTFMVIQRNYALFIFTSIIGLYGGLMKTFRYVVPAMVTIYKIILRKIRNIRNNSIIPQVFVTNSTRNME